ncbi:serine/threonine-protein kinase, partial [Candidatus Woesearchaeota archaeon]|nr:serine/threonine-protein kinase [Candidatus Woesearchaeota archaeon]
IEKFRKKYKTLDQQIIDNGPFDIKDFEQTFEKILRSGKYYMNKFGILHRDPKASNILFRKNGSIDIWLTDWANAGTINNNKYKIMPTSGGHFILDPISSGIFSERQSTYNIQSELYAFGTEGTDMLLGDYDFEFDPDKEIGIYIPTGESMLNEKGKLDKEKFSKQLWNSLKEIKGEPKKYRELLYRLRTPYENERFESINEVVNEFEKIKSKKSFVQKVKKHKNTIIISSLILTGGSGIGLQTYQQLNKEILEAKKYPVNTAWNGADLTINNSLFDIKISSSVFNGGKNYSKYPGDKFLVAKPGETIHAYIEANGKPFSKENYNSLWLPAKAYIEGYEISNEFNFYVDDPDKAYCPDDMYGYPYGDINMKLPEDIHEGISKMIIEVYSPNPKINKRNSKDAMNKINLQSSGRVLLRKKIPIIVGDPKFNVTVNNLYIGSYTEYISFGPFTRLNDYVDELSKDINYIISLTGTDFKELWTNEGNIYNSKSGYIKIPDGQKNQEGILKILYQDKNNQKITGFDFVPLIYKDTTYANGYRFGCWDFNDIDTNYFKTVTKLGQEALDLNK